MIAVKKIFSHILLLLALTISTNVVTAAPPALTTDSRIKSYIYNPNEVYLLILHHGFQSYVEFAKGETISTITIGDSYSWKITPMGNRLFIKPMERNIQTNMTIITNRRTYQFDLISKELSDSRPEDLVYVIRFRYPKK